MVRLAVNDCEGLTEHGLCLSPLSSRFPDSSSILRGSALLAVRCISEKRLLYSLMRPCPLFPEKRHRNATNISKRYVDDQLFCQRTKWTSNVTSNEPYQAPFDAEFEIILNLAVGGSLPGRVVDDGAFPATMLVDYVRCVAALACGGYCRRRWSQCRQSTFAAGRNSIRLLPPPPPRSSGR